MQSSSPRFKRSFPASTYKHDYQGVWDINRREPYKTTSTWEPPSGEFNALTAYHDEYTTHPLQSKFVQEKIQWTRPTESFENTSINHRDFTPKNASRRDQIKPKQELTPYNGPSNQPETTMKESYKQWNIPDKFMRPPAMYEYPIEKMMTTSAYHDDYIIKNSPRQKAVVIKSEWVKPQDLEPTNTTYKSEYTKHALSQRVNFNPYANQNKENNYVPFVGITTHNADYTSKFAERQHEFRPNGEIERSNQPFEGTTTTQDSYKEWQLPRKFVRDRVAYVEPLEKMHNSTSYKAEYTAHLYSKLPPIRPGINDEPVGKFDGLTTHRNAYQSYANLQKADSFKPQRQYEQPTEPFEKNSSYRDDYTPREGQPRPSAIRHEAEFTLADGGYFIDDTTYKFDYDVTPRNLRAMRASNENLNEMGDAVNYGYYVTNGEMAGKEMMTAN